jgi:ATP/maltotriose-dependent transcriptional regulator MalT
MNPFFKASAAALVGHLLLRRGEHARAIELTRSAVGKGGPYVDALALTVLASALVAIGRHEDALATVASADARQTQSPLYPTLLALARAEALMGLGRRDEASAAIRAARDRIVATARGLTDPEDRASWLGVRANVRTLALASDWLGERDGHA